jgi:hypothetical protein
MPNWQRSILLTCFFFFSFPSGELVLCSPILKREREQNRTMRNCAAGEEFYFKSGWLAGVEEFGIGPPTETEKARRRSLRS